jgi:hypothetical protein
VCYNRGGSVFCTKIKNKIGQRPNFQISGAKNAVEARGDEEGSAFTQIAAKYDSFKI